MTNKEYIIACLNDEIDDGGASFEACVYYNIACPYTVGDERAHCYNLPSAANDDYTERRKRCFACKAEWLESEADE